MIGILDITFLAGGGAGCATGSGGSTGGYGIAASPDGGTYSNGLEVTMSWTSFPSCATHLRITRTNESGSPGVYEVIGYDNLPVGPMSGVVTLVDPDVPPNFQIKPQKIFASFVDFSDPENMIALNTDEWESNQYT